MKTRPRLTKKVYSGIRAIRSVIDAELTAGPAGYFDESNGAAKGDDDAALEALNYLDNLLAWYDVKHPRRPRDREN
jgi:hypothetical protein